MPSNQKATMQVNHLVLEQKRVADLGSGFGFFLYQLAKKHPETTFIGYENSWLPYLVSKLFTRKNLHFQRANFYKINLHSYDTLLTYLCPAAMQRIEKLIQKQKLKVKLISNTFALPTMHANKKMQLTDWQQSMLYLYDFSA